MREYYGNYKWKKLPKTNVESLETKVEKKKEEIMELLAKRPLNAL